MTQYLLSVHDVVDADDVPTDPAELQKIYDAVDVFNEKVRAAGAWVFAGGLMPIDATTCVDNTRGRTVVTDGPFAESKEYLGGFWIIEAPDLDAALKLGRGGLEGLRRQGRGPTVPGRVTGLMTELSAQIERVFREEHARVVASLARRFGDLDIAEEAAGEALVLALEKWPVDGLPPNPGGWLTTTAGNKAIDRIRREGRRDDKHRQATMEADRRGDHDPAPEHTGVDRGRPAPAGVHLLPPGPGPRGPGRPDPATHRRAHGAGDRRRLSCPRDNAWPSD